MAELNARIIAKASGTASEEPLAADLEVAELAVNTADGKLFTKHTDGSIVTISGGDGGGTSSPAIVYANTDTAPSGTSSSVTLPTSIAAGDTIAIHILVRGSVVTWRCTILLDFAGPTLTAHHRHFQLHAIYRLPSADAGATIQSRCGHSRH